jgi:hypothetical protein
MKKFTVFIHKKLQQLLLSDKEFRSTNLLHNAMALSDFAIQYVIGSGTAPLEATLVCAKAFEPSDEIKKMLEEVLERTGRVESRLTPGLSDSCIAVEVLFIDKKIALPLLRMIGSVESSGIRLLRVTLVSNRLQSTLSFPDSLRAFQVISRC